MQESIQKEHEDMMENQSPTQHEPHEHARPRLLIGIGAVLVIAVGYVVWANWGDEIKEACLGDGEVCTIELPSEPSNEETVLE